MENDQIVPVVSIVGGLSLGGFFWWMVSIQRARAGAWGVIPVALGLACLVGSGLSYWLASRGKPDAPRRDADTR